MCSNELQCVAFASSRNFTRGSIPREGTRCIIFLFFTQSFLCACRVCVPISVANGQKTWPPNVNIHTHTHTHTDRQFELYILESLFAPGMRQSIVKVCLIHPSIKDRYVWSCAVSYERWKCICWFITDTFDVPVIEREGSS